MVMKLPNGFGSVYKLPGNRRKPWIARKTVGWTPEGKQLYYTVGYYATRKEALAALSEYNKNPIGAQRDVTLVEIYEKWSASKYSRVSKSTVQTYSAAWKHLSAIGHLPARDVRKSHIQEIIDGMSNMSRSSQVKVKTLAGLLLKEAMADDIVIKNYAELVDMPDAEKKKKERFTDAEIRTIERLAKTDIWANTIMILIYTGMRIGELLGLTKFNVDIENMLITGGIKTDKGRNRVIPINPKIQGYIRYWYEQPGSYLITRDGDRVTRDYYRKSLYYPLLEAAKIRKLTPHCTRHTFASLLSRAGTSTKYIQDLIGHTDYAVTANIYTHPDVEELRKAIESI
jgi:integrase